MLGKKRLLIASLLFVKRMSSQNIESQQRNRALSDAENYIKEACEILKREASRVRQEQESIDAMSKQLDQVHFSSTVKLNIGGQHFVTSVQTLRKDPNSMLAAMFSGKFDTKPSEDGSFFIDRDGTHFRFILNYLRDGELILPEGATALKQFQKEAEFYQIQGILDELKPPPLPLPLPREPTRSFEESMILQYQYYQQTLKGWLPTDLEGEWRLLFRASRDGFGSQTFHSKCDNKGPTITVVAESGSNIFGGFIEISWIAGNIDKVIRRAGLYNRLYK